MQFAHLELICLGLESLLMPHSGHTAVTHSDVSRLLVSESESEATRTMAPI